MRQINAGYWECVKATELRAKGAYDLCYTARDYIRCYGEGSKWVDFINDIEWSPKYSFLYLKNIREKKGRFIHFETSIAHCPIIANQYLEFLYPNEYRNYIGKFEKVDDIVVDLLDDGDCKECVKCLIGFFNCKNWYRDVEGLVW